MISHQNSRWYLLRVTNKYPNEASLFLFGTLSQTEKAFSNIKEEAEKAFRSGYKRILLPWNFVFHSERKKIVQWILQRPEKFSLSVHEKSFVPFQNLFSQHKKEKLFIDLCVENINEKLLKKMEDLSWSFQISILAHKGVHLNQLHTFLSKRYRNKSLILNKKTEKYSAFEEFKLTIKSLVFKFTSYIQTHQAKALYIYIHFPCYHKRHPKIYTSKEMYHFLKKSFYPPPQVDIYNLSIPKDLKLEPEIKPEFSFSISNKKPLASIIIPSYNSIQELSITLKHLVQQDLTKKEWEVIVVDDGSEDETLSILKKLNFLSHINFKFVFFPRKLKRTGPLDHRFRAGIARNLGVKQALGKFLFFLDSDILTPSFYISSVCNQLEKKNVIQHPRYHLTKEAPRDYSKIDKHKHTFIKIDNYWENFYATAKNWNRKHLPWKYISTNTLCLKSTLFKQVGWFKKNYTCYGFEDTDLGYRLYQAGVHFKLNPINTYHLYRPSEFFNSDTFKQKLLAQSANLFFHNNHSLKSYEEFCHLIQETENP